MKRFLTTIAALCLATASHAATIDFAAEADNNGERGVADGTTINSAETDNLNVTLSATGNDKAYLDSGNAGLGVCGTLDNGAQCDPSSDDNLQSGEEVNVKIDDAEFEFITDGEWAWPSTQGQEPKVIEAMKRGNEAVLTARSERGTQTKDTFSLLGFTAAIDDAKQRCTK